MSARAIVLAMVVAAVTVLSLGVASVGAPHPSVSAPAAAASSSTAVPSLVKASSAPNAPSLASREALEQQVLSTAQSRHIPLSAVSLPNLLGQATISNGVVSPLTTVAPAPMGIGTWGVLNTTGTPTAYTIETNSWEGTITLTKINTFWLDNDGALNTEGTNNTFGVQLNTVTVNTTVGNTENNSFWTQNVFYWNLEPGYITFLDNVWNFSSPAVQLTDGTIYAGNGTPVYPDYYYDFGPSVPVTLPVTVHLYINSSTTDLAGIGYTTVRFGYDVVNGVSGLSEASGIYDTVLFNSSVPFAEVPASPFLVSGSQITPTGFLLYDAEIMIGGPGGGTTTSVYGIGGSESLKYWDAEKHAYLNPPSAWNVGTDTGESVEGVAETYTSPGTVLLGAGPSIPAPFWNSTPGGNLGQATFTGTLSPTNAFVFFTAGSSFNAGLSAWAPTQTESTVSYVLPPGTYTVNTLLSDYTPLQATVTGRAGASVTLHLALSKNPAEGVYTPLDAWDNAQLAAISSSGDGSASSPYVLVNNAAPGGLNPAFGELNDYLYPVFPGLLLAGTTDHVTVEDSSLFGLTYPARLQATLTGLDLPITNNLQFEIYEASDVTLWHTNGITGWFFWEDYGPTGGVPLANVVVFGGSHDLVGDNTFDSQGSSLLLANINPDLPTGNVVWGNTFVNSASITSGMYPYGTYGIPSIGVFAFEAGDLIYNNYVATSLTVYAPDENFFYGFGQLNLENWNLSMVEPRSYSTSFNGFDLTGTIVPSEFQGGNYWADYVVGSTLPYDEYGYIESGGDYFPLPIVAYEVEFALYTTGSEKATWSVTLNGVTQSTSGGTLVFYEVPGTYDYTVTLVSGHGTISPSSGTVTVTDRSVVVPLTLGVVEHPGAREHLLPPVSAARSESRTVATAR